CDFLVHGVVFHEQDASLAARLQSGGVDGPALRLNLAHRRQFEAGSEPERRARSLAAFDADVAAEQLGETLDDGQAEPGTAVATSGRRIDLRERLEQRVQAIGRDAAARVANRAAKQDVLHIAARDRESEGHTAVLRELDGVSAEVHEYLPETIGVAIQNSRHGRIDRYLHRQSLRLCGDADRAHD